MKSTLRSSASLILLTVSLLAASALAQNNPVPQVVGPPHPQAVAPGGGDFTLKVYGANFVPGAVVNWNRQPRTTTYVSGHEVDATILASDIVSNTAGYITVTNPPPGGGVSSASWTLVEVHEPTSTVTPGKPTINLEGGSSLLAADFTNHGILDLAVSEEVTHVDLGNGNGTFRFVSNATDSVFEIFGNNNTAYGDFNGDGNLDLAYSAIWGPHDEPQTGMAVSLGNGNGTFNPGWRFVDTSNVYVTELVAGDFNRDGKLDLAAGDAINTSVFLGNGDGTLKLTTTYSGVGGVNVVTGDFNGDGILDLLFYGDETSQGTQGPISIAFGNGDGTFQTPVNVAAPGGQCAFSPRLLVSDFNGDGNLDIAYCSTRTSIGILLANGDGTFQKPTYYSVGSGGDFSFTAGDFTSDGNTDLLVSNYDQGEVAILLGNGDGTFQPRTQVMTDQNAENGIVTGDFNSDGLLDFIFQTGDFALYTFLQQ
jgi:hypothetical protein